LSNNTIPHLQFLDYTIFGPTTMTISESLSKAVPTGLKIPKTANGSKAELTTPGPKTPKTPQDEALAFFSEEKHSGEKVQVWELWLEDDGGPGENKSVSARSCRIRPLTAVHPSAPANTAIRAQAVVTSRHGVHEAWCAEE